MSVVGTDADGNVAPAASTPIEITALPVTLTGVWHAFSGDLAEAQAAYDLGLALGLGGPVTFQNARSLRALVQQLRLDRLILETDAPYLAPHPHRGQRNEPAYIPLMAAALAQLAGTTVDIILAKTTATAGRCFRPALPVAESAGRGPLRPRPYAEARGPPASSVRRLSNVPR